MVFPRPKGHCFALQANQWFSTKKEKQKILELVAKPGPGRLPAVWLAPQKGRLVTCRVVFAVCLGATHGGDEDVSLFSQTEHKIRQMVVCQQKVVCCCFKSKAWYVVVVAAFQMWFGNWLKAESRSWVIQCADPSLSKKLCWTTAELLLCTRMHGVGRPVCISPFLLKPLLKFPKTQWRKNSNHNFPIYDELQTESIKAFAQPWRTGSSR